MTASTKYSGHPAHHGRLKYSNSAWCAQSSSGSQDWLRIDLGTTYQICGAATQGTGHQSFNEYVTKFKLSYSSDGSSWTMYTGTGGSETVGLKARKKNLNCTNMAEFRGFAKTLPY